MNTKPIPGKLIPIEIGTGVEWVTGQPVGKCVVCGKKAIIDRDGVLLCYDDAVFGPPIGHITKYVKKAQVEQGWACSECDEFHRSYGDAVRCCAPPPPLAVFQCPNEECGETHERLPDALKCCGYEIGGDLFVTLDEG